MILRNLASIFTNTDNILLWTLSPLFSNLIAECNTDMYLLVASQNPSKKYNLDYYLSLVDKIVAMGAHILGKLVGPMINVNVANRLL